MGHYDSKPKTSAKFFRHIYWSSGLSVQLQTEKIDNPFQPHNIEIVLNYCRASIVLYCRILKKKKQFMVFMHLEYLYATGGFGALLERVKLLVLFPGRVSGDSWCCARQYFCPPPPASNVSLNGAHNPNCSTKIHSDQVVLKGFWAYSGDFQTAVLLAVFRIPQKLHPPDHTVWRVNQCAHLLNWALLKLGGRWQTLLSRELVCFAEAQHAE